MARPGTKHFLIPFVTWLSLLTIPACAILPVPSYPSYHANAREKWDAQGVPLLDVPLGLAKMRAYGVTNAVLEANFACRATNWDRQVY